jgi:SPP1 gp7 family putative phage head morphogenesis protein
MAFWSRKKEKTSESGKAGGNTFKDFIEAAVLEMEGLMAQDLRWYYTLPYTGAMSLEEAKTFEIEKRALWRRVIYDARRTKLPGLKWETRGDAKVCPDCQKMEGRIFSLEEYDGLNQRVMHIGCRCNLVSVRE